MTFLCFSIHDLFATNASDLKITVSIPPLQYIVNQLTTDIEGILTHTLVQSEKNPHIAQLQTVYTPESNTNELFLFIGLPFEAKVIDLLKDNPHKKILDLSLPIKKRMFTSHEADCGCGDTILADDNTPKQLICKINPDSRTDNRHIYHHFAGESDPHIWLSLSHLSTIVQLISDTLKVLPPLNTPKNIDLISQHTQGLQKQIALLQENIKKQLQPFKDKDVFVFHSAYGYFCDENSLRQVAIEFEGQIPSSKQLTKIIEKAQSKRAKIFLVQPQFDQALLKQLSDRLAIKVSIINPLEENVLKNLEKIAMEIAGAFQ